ncbi:MAG TPA: phosphatase PAP2 family protein [Candidatus Paceibacterota bacterium]|nr:phosphatase PAP2 family protein [Candidatus Paceibacterota bacterium]
MDTVIIFIAQYLYGIILLIGAIFFFLQSRKIQKSMLICGLIIAPLAYVISRIVGALYYDPRPFVVGHFIPLIAHAPDNGFPSDHMLLTGAVAMVLWFYNKKLSVALWVLALLIGWARVYSGIHHVTDIAGSIIIVLIVGVVYYLLVGGRKGNSDDFEKEV